MSAPAQRPRDDGSLSRSLELRRDSLCDRFEAAWRDGSRPRLETFWSDPAAANVPDLLSELLAIELAYRVRLRERPVVGEYLSRFPSQAGPIRAAFEAAAITEPLPHAPRSDGNRNLLFGVLALQMDFITREALIAAVSAWSSDSSRSLDQILVDQGALGTEERALLEPLIKKHLERHGEDPERSLAAAVAPNELTRHDLEQVGDSDVLDSLALAAGRTNRGSFARGDVPVLLPAADDRRDAAARRRFQILRLLARGGLGEVFVARDEELLREVALKVIQPSHADDPESRGRFQREAEVTGRLEHPGVVPVYGLGVDERGRPFYAMRFIRGESLKDAIDRFHEPKGAGSDPTRRALELRALLGRFVDVCDAVGYAHSRGVIHRDLKPANVMLGAYGETLVVDWGLAKVAGVSDTVTSSGESPIEMDSGCGTTRQGTWVGTPAYMSPEQAEGNVEGVSPASDIYSLGATLYCLLTGKPPFEGIDVFTALDKVRRGDFRSVREVDHRVPAALEAISAKAMARVPDDRYSTPLELAEDVQRWLADEPVSAFREPAAARLMRLARRHRSIVAAATALIATAAVALGVSTFLIGQEAGRKEQQRQRAEENFVLARDAVDRMLTEVAEVDLADVPQMQSARKVLLERAREFYQAFLSQKQDDRMVQFEAGRAEIRLGRINDLLGDHQTAEEAYGSGIATLTKLAEREPRAIGIRRELARGRDGLGMLLRKANRFRESEVLLRAAFDARERLARERPKDLAERHAAAESRYHLGVLLARMGGRGSEDESTYREAVRSQEALVTDARDRPELRQSLARFLNNLGLLLKANGEVGKAENAFRESISILEVLVARDRPAPTDRWQLARARANLAETLRVATRKKEAEALCLKARESLAALLNDYPDLPDYRHELAATLNNLGLIQFDNGKRVEAEQAFRDALAHQETLANAFPRCPDFLHNLAVSRINLASMLERSNVREAARMYGEALAIHERLASAYPEATEYQLALGRNLYSLAGLELGGDLDGALDRLNRAVDRHRGVLEADPRSRIARDYLLEDYGVLCIAYLRANALARAADVAEEFPRLFPNEWSEYRRAAAFLMVCASKSPRSESSAGGAASEPFTSRAIAVLRRAVQGGVIKPEELDKDPEFKPLRKRDDFQKLIRGEGAPAAPRVS